MDIFRPFVFKLDFLPHLKKKKKEKEKEKENKNVKHTRMVYLDNNRRLGCCS